MKKENYITILDYLKTKLIDHSIEKIFSNIINENSSVALLNNWNSNGENYNDVDDPIYGIRNVLYELDMLIGVEENDEDTVNYFRSYKKARKKNLYHIDEISSVKKELKKILLKLNNDDFFKEIFQIKALRLNSLFENVQNLTKEDLKNSPIVSKEAEKYQLSNLENWIDSDFLIFESKDIFRNIIKDSFPFSLKNTSVLPEKYKYNSRLYNLEGNLFYKKSQELADKIRDEIKSPKNLDIVESIGIIKKLSKHIIGYQYNSFDLQDYLFKNYLKLHLINQNVDILYETIEKYYHRKDKAKYNQIIAELKVREGSTDEKPLTDLIEYAKKQKNYKAACLYLEINDFLSKNLKKSLATSIVKDAVKDGVSFQDLDAEQLLIYPLILELFNKEEYENKKNILREQFANGNGFEVPSLEVKTITISYEKFIYMFQKDYREQSFKNALGFAFDSQFGFHIDYKNNQVRITLEYEGVLKMNNNELLFDSIDLIEIMLNKQDGKKFFHQMKLKSKLNMSHKDEIDRGSRRKI